MRKKFSCVAKTERENGSKLLSFEFNSFLEDRGEETKEVCCRRRLPSGTRKIDRSLERRKKKKRTRSTPMGLARILQPLLTLVLLPARLLSMFFFPSEQPGFLLFLVLCCPTSATRTLEPVFFPRGRNNKKKELDEANSKPR